MGLLSPADAFIHPGPGQLQTQSNGKSDLFIQGTITHKLKDTGGFDFIQAVIKNANESSQVLIFP